MKSGVYKIVNKKNGKYYVGSTCDFYQRKHNHFSKLKKGKHPNRYLQNAWNKYGQNNFSFEVVACCPEEYTIKLEQWFLDNLEPAYNLLPIAGTTKGRIVSNQEKYRLKNLRQGSKLSEGHKKALLGSRGPMSEEEKKNLSLRMKNRTISPETRERMRLSKLGNTNKKKKYAISFASTNESLFCH